MPPSYQLGVMPPPTAAPGAPVQYPQGTSPALLPQYHQYHTMPPAAPLPPPVRAPAPASDYYIPVINDHHSYSVNIPNTQQQQLQPQQQQQLQQPQLQPQQGFTGVYDTRPSAHTPTTLPGMFSIVLLDLIMYSIIL